jgi:hypothetical protein
MKEIGHLKDAPSQPSPFPPFWLLLQTILNTIEVSEQQFHNLNNDFANIYKDFYFFYDAICE